VFPCQAKSSAYRDWSYAKVETDCALQGVVVENIVVGRFVCSSLSLSVCVSRTAASGLGIAGSLGDPLAGHKLLPLGCLFRICANRKRIRYGLRLQRKRGTLDQTVAIVRLCPTREVGIPLDLHDLLHQLLLIHFVRVYRKQR
jgi:hypothetical protein